MYQVSLKSISEALGFSYFGNENVIVDSVVIDSRLASSKSLFIAFKGEQTDGHNYIESAISKGAVGIVCENLPENINQKVGYVIANGRLFLEKLAYFMRERFTGEVIAITGSYGKTSTKDLMTDLLKAHYDIVVTHENQNNELGVPLTLSRLTEKTEVLIVEMGMDALGDIDYLAKMVKPTKGIITSIGMVHAEHLGGKEKIAQAKSELIPYLAKDSLLVLRKKDEDFLVPYLKDYRGKIIWAGDDIFASEIKLDTEKTRFIYHENGTCYPLWLLHLGAHYVENALLAIAVARSLNLSMEDIASGLRESEHHSLHRMEKIYLKSGGLLYNDSYNANPDSMKATLKVLALHKPMMTIAVLGDMFELGVYEESGHLEVGKAVYEEKIDLLITLGKASKWIDQAALKAGMKQEKIYHFTDLKEASQCILRHYRPNTAILLKGSRGMKMEEILKEIKEIVLEGEV